MLSLLKNRYMIGVMILMVMVTCFGSYREKMMTESNLPDNYVSANIR